MSSHAHVSDPSAFGKVAVVMGGWSAEREISLKSGGAVLRALQGQGVDAHGIDADRSVVQQLAVGGFDRVFIVLHGRGGEDGALQGALDVMGLPYTGSGVLASAIGMDKWRSKLVWQASGLPVPLTLRLSADFNADSVVAELGLPLFVKPASEGSSIGVTKVTNAADLQAAYDAAREHDPIVLAERCLDGGEYTVSLLAGEALPAIKIEPAREFYDYQAKYFSDDTTYRCPCGLDSDAEQRMQQLALDAFAVVGGRGWGRIDFLLDQDGAPYVLEANTVPGMTDHSLVPMAARQTGLSFEQLVWRILETSVTATDEV